MFLHDLTIKKFGEGLRNKQFSAFEIAKGFLDYIVDKDKEIGAFLAVDRDGALAAASRVDVALAEGKNLSPLAGVPLAIKDNILIEGLVATGGSKILEHYTAAYDATVIQKLKEASAIFLGKTNLDEFAMGSSTENSGYHVTHNPHDLTRVPGGSSGGSAAAVAGKMALGALGTDTGGSIREPASFCGVVGLKPTYGAVSRYGAMAMASSLDQIGPLTKTVHDATLLFKTIAGRDDFDGTSTAHDYQSEDFSPSLETVKKLRVGLPKEYFGPGMSPEVEKGMQSAIAAFKGLGLQFIEISLPHTKYALSTYYVIMPAEVSSNLARYDGIRYGHRGDTHKTEPLLDLYLKSRGHGFGEEARRRIILGTFVLSSGYYDAYYAKAQKVRRLIKEDFDRAFEEVDMIFAPVAPTPAFKIGERAADPLAMYLSDIFTIPVNLAGLPAVSIPVYGQKGLPVGFQLIGKHFREADILGAGQYYDAINKI